MSSSCSICFDKIYTQSYRLCLGCTFHRIHTRVYMNTVVCVECSKNCIKSSIYDELNHRIYCSYACLYRSVDYGDNILAFVNSYEFNRLDELTKLALTNSQTNLIEYWNYEKNKSIVQLIINGYLINDITNVVLEYLQP